jgi:hypothetical protein
MTTMSGWFCGSCGKVLGDNDTFCGTCGAPVVASQRPGQLLPPPSQGLQPAAVPTVPDAPVTAQVVAFETYGSAIPPTGRRRKRWPWIVAAAAVLAAAGVVAALVVVSDDTESTGDAVDSSSAAPQTDDVAADDTTATTSSSSASETGTTAVPTFVTVVVPVASTVPPTIATLPLPPPSVATADTTPKATTAPTTVLVPGDLEIAGYTMTKPACDEQFITVVSNAVLPDTYQQAVRDALQQYPGSSYLRTDQTCSSLRPSLDGNPIYVIYYGPFVSMADACDSRSLGPADAYVRRLSTAYPSNHIVDCP